MQDVSWPKLAQPVGEILVFPCAPANSVPERKRATGPEETVNILGGKNPCAKNSEGRSKRTKPPFRNTPYLNGNVTRGAANGLSLKKNRGAAKGVYIVKKG